MVDATLVESSRKRPEIKAVAEGRAPDADASYTRNHRRSFYGYKAHVSSDGEHQLIRTALITTASAQEAHYLERIAPQIRKKFMGTRLMTPKPTRRGCANEVSAAV